MGSSIGQPVKCEIYKGTSRLMAPAETRAYGVHEKYSLGRTLGVGAFSVVREATCLSTGQKFACKVTPFYPDESRGNIEARNHTHSSERSSLEEARRESEVASCLNSSNILSVHEVFVENGKLFVIVDLLTGGNLAEALAERGSLPESDAKQIFVRIVSACEHMHSRGVVHRDLKLENIMLVNGDDICNVRVVDFGLAAMGRTKDDLGVKPGGYHPMPLPVNEGLTTLCGTPLYVAPEVVEAATLMTNRQYGSAVDMWSAGVILFMLLGGYPPFAEQNIVALFKGITKGFSPTHFCADPVWSLISDDAKNLLQALLTSDPLRRITASEALQHPWCRADMM